MPYGLFNSAEARIRIRRNPATPNLEANPSKRGGVRVIETELLTTDTGRRRWGGRWMGVEEGWWDGGIQPR